MNGRRAWAAAGTAAVATMLGGSWAWACTAAPSIVSVDPLGEASPDAGSGFGLAGSTVRVQGLAVSPGAPVSIRWNATDGPVIGVAPATNNGKFAVAATVPAAAAPGIYYMVADLNGVAVARTAFEVTGPGIAAPAQGGSLWAAAPSAPAPATGSSASGGATSGVVGVGLLGGGLVLLFGGATAATLSRRRGRAAVR